MSAVIRISTLLLLGTATTSFLPSARAILIKSLNIPETVRNGTGPVDLSCIYQVAQNDQSLVVKWYHGADLIYQWIPALRPPLDLGVIRGFAEYPRENLRHPHTHSIIRLKTVTTDMSGEYSCLISTFEEEAVKTAKMIVYEPETRASIDVERFNETHVNLICTVEGAYPPPALAFYVEGEEISDAQEILPPTDTYAKDRQIKRQITIQEADGPVVVECELSIPESDYKCRKKIVHYPHLRGTDPLQWSTDGGKSNFKVMSVVNFLALISVVIKL